MRNFRPVSIVPDAGSPLYALAWPCTDTSLTLPPGNGDYAAPTGFPYWYFPASIAGDANNSFTNNFYARVPLWEVFGEVGAPDVSDMLITPDNTEGLTEPIQISTKDMGPDWTMGTNTVTLVGDRSFYIDGEVRLPNSGMLSISEEQGSFQFRHTVTWFYTPGGGPATGPQVTIDYVVEFRGHEPTLYNKQAYIPCKHYYIWTWVDDGGTSNGGWVSRFEELTGPDAAFIVDAAAFNTLWRVGKREFGASQHFACFGMQAYMFDTEGANFATSGLRTGETLPVDSVELELDGNMKASEAWIQPDQSTPGHTEKYFGYRWDDGDDATALYDVTEGACLVDAPDFPYNMTEQVP